MFDIGFWELALIAVVALLVVGPEKLPGLARTAGHWLGRARRFVATVKQDIDREIAADELKKVLAKQAETNPLHDIIEETRHTIHDAQGKPAEPSQTPGGAVTQKPNDPNG